MTVFFCFPAGPRAFHVRPAFPAFARSAFGPFSYSLVYCVFSNFWPGAKILLQSNPLRDQHLFFNGRTCFPRLHPLLFLQTRAYPR